MSTTDKAPELAKFLVEETKGLSHQQMIDAVAERFPDITQDETLRGIETARDFKMAVADMCGDAADSADRIMEELFCTDAAGMRALAVEGLAAALREELVGMAAAMKLVDTSTMKPAELAEHRRILGNLEASLHADAA